MTITTETQPGPSYRRPERDCYRDYRRQRELERLLETLIPSALIIAGTCGLWLLAVNFWRWVG